MNKEIFAQSQFGRALAQFSANRLAVACLIILAVIHGAAVFADFFAPYSSVTKSAHILTLRRARSILEMIKDNGRGRTFTK